MPLRLDGTNGISGVVGSASSAAIYGADFDSGLVFGTDQTTITAGGVGVATVNRGGIILSGITTVSAGTTSAPSITPTGDSNTGIFFPSADTIAFAEGGVEASRFDSNGNLGINTASVPDKLTVLGKIQVQQDASSNNRLVLRGQPGSSYRWNIDNYSSSNDFRIFREDDATAASGAVAVSISSTRNVTLSNGNLVFSTAGTGIDFSATSNAAGMTSELLSDYEEGTWTPGISGTSGGTYTAGSGNVGRYVKVGNLVTASATIEWTARPVAYTGSLIITGLPFSALNVTGYRAAGIFPVQSVGIYASGSYIQLKAALDWNNSFVYVVQAAETISAGANYNHTPTVLTTGALYGFAITYISN